MTAPRFDVYTLVHKGQRHKLFELTGAAGRIDLHDHDTRAALASEVAKFIVTLEEHAEHEDRFLGPLHREANPNTAHRVADEHVALQADVAAVQVALARARVDVSAAADLAVYRALARLTSTYLAHVEIEENAMPELWARFDDPTLAAVQAKLVAAHRPETVRFNLHAMLPAASRTERVRFLSGMRKNLPPPAYSALRASVESLLDGQEWAAVEGA